MSGLASVRERVLGCEDCGLCRTRTNPVPGAGNPDADIMLVGEAPGRDEDARGEPFVGAAGRRLSVALEGAGISRGDVYITNVVKCRPPGNRVPLPQEEAACSGHLAAEIEAVDPRVICVMGNTAFGSLLGGSGVTRFRGKTFLVGGRLYFVSLHPAAVIYNRDLSQALDGDIRELAAISERIGRGECVRADHHGRVAS